MHFKRRKIIRCIICLLILLSNYISATAQVMQSQKILRLSVSAYAGKVFSTDKHFSNQSFSGFCFGGAGFLQYQSGKAIHELEMLYLSGSLKPGVHASSADISIINGSYYNLYTIGDAARSALSCKAGGAIDILYVKRMYDDFVNNQASFEFAGSVAAAFEINWQNIHTSGLRLSDRISLPLITLLQQPGFGGGQGGETTITSLNTFLRIRNKLSLEKTITGGQSLSIAYVWDFYRVHTDREVLQANHQVAITYIFTL